MATSITNTSITTDDLIVDSADNLLKVDHATNRVGIGTITPDTVFHVNAVDPPGSVMAKFVSNGNPWIQRVGSGGSWQTGVTTNGYEFYNDTNSQYNVVISPTGNVGIGTRSPARQLSIVDDGTNGQAIMELIDSTNNNLAGIFLGRANNTNIGGIRYFHSTNHLALRSNDVDALIIDSSGNVGIGTEDPSENLEIKTSGPALKLTDTANSNNNIKMSQGYNSYLTASNNVYMSAGGHTDMLNLLNGAVQVKKTRTGTISGGASDTGAVIKLHTEAQWESGYGNNALATTNDYLGGIEFHTGDGSTGEGLRAAVRGTVDSYYNQNSIVFETADGATAADPIERMRVWHNGQVTMPYQPCFGAILGAHINASNYLTGWTAQTNVGSHFNAGDGTFTAPVTGQYYFYVSVMRATNDSGDYSVQIKKNGSTVRLSNDMANGSYVTYMQTTVPAVLTLAANDNIRFYIGNTVSTSYAYQGTYTHCGGYLIG